MEKLKVQLIINQKHASIRPIYYSYHSLKLILNGFRFFKLDLSVQMLNLTNQECSCYSLSNLYLQPSITLCPKNKLPCSYFAYLWS